MEIDFKIQYLLLFCQGRVILASPSSIYMHCLYSRNLEQSLEKCRDGLGLSVAMSHMALTCLLVVSFDPIIYLKLIVSTKRFVLVVDDVTIENARKKFYKYQEPKYHQTSI